MLTKAHKNPAVAKKVNCPLQMIHIQWGKMSANQNRALMAA